MNTSWRSALPSGTPAILSVLAALLLACTAPNPDLHAGDGGTTVKCPSQCPSGQVCQGSTCVDLPSQCPCPKESYCELADNKCVAGCLMDSDCATGRICNTETRMCSDGCRSDSTCPAGQICDPATSMCRPGCDAEVSCPQGQICLASVCKAGCTMDGQCAKGEICNQNTCQPGCRMNTDCPTGQICNANQCTSGCQSDTDCPQGDVCDTAHDMCRKGLRPAFITKLITGSDASEPYARIGDINGDGKLDVLVGDGVLPSFAVYLGKGDGTFNSGPAFNNTFDVTLLLVDVNGDKRADVVGLNNASVAVYLGQTDGSFTTGATHTISGVSPNSLVVANFDGSGKPGVAVGYMSSAYASVVLNANSTTTMEKQYSLCADGVQRILAGDMDGNGSIDLAAGCNGGSFAAVLNSGTGSFAAAKVEQSTLVPDMTWDTLHDINGDGKADLVVPDDANPAGTTVSAALNQGGNKFAAPVTATVATGPTELAIADLNQDGIVDVAVVSSLDGVTGGTLSILLGRGDGTFLPTRNFTLAGVPVRVLAGDFNNDGLPDLMIPIDGSGINILLNHSM